MKLGVVVAFEQEIGLLAQHGAGRVVAGVPVAEARFGGTDAVLALSGIGKANAAACTQLLISAMGADAILNIGLSGSACALPLGGAVVAQRAVYHDLLMSIAAESAPGVEVFTADEALCALADRVLDGLGTPHQRGILATGDQFIGDSARKADIVARTGCACVEMEGAAVAHIAQKNGVPFCLVKILSDSAEDGALDTFHETISVADYLKTSVGFIRAFAEGLPAAKKP